MPNHLLYISYPWHPSFPFPLCLKGGLGVATLLSSPVNNKGTFPPDIPATCDRAISATGARQNVYRCPEAGVPQRDGGPRRRRRRRRSAPAGGAGGGRRVAPGGDRRSPARLSDSASALMTVFFRYLFVTEGAPPSVTNRSFLVKVHGVYCGAIVILSRYVSFHFGLY